MENVGNETSETTSRARVSVSKARKEQPVGGFFKRHYNVGDEIRCENLG
jgi:hypothetical protein